MPELMIYDDIGADFFGDGVSAKGIKAQLDEFTGDIDIRINSLGGDVFEGHAIYNLIKKYEGKKTVYIDGIAASAASIIAMAGDEVIMPINAMLMIHDPWTMAMGDSAEMRKTAEVLDKVKQTIVNVYMDKTGLPEEELSEMMTAETWFDSDEAVENGFAMKGETHAVLNKPIARQWINKAPEIKEEIQPEPQPEIEEYQIPNITARKRYLEIMADAI